MDPTIIVAAITGLTSVLGVGLPLWFKNKKTEKERDNAQAQIKDTELQLSIYNSLLTMQSVSNIAKAVDLMFERTSANRFLILVGLEVNGFVKTVSVVFEQHQDEKNRVNAIARYHNVDIDDHYRQMLKDAEKYGKVDMEVSTMQPCLLKNFYEVEGITYSKVRFLHRKEVEPTKSVLAFSSIATHSNTSFSDQEKAFMKAMYDSSIVPVIRGLFQDPSGTDLEQQLLNK